MSKWNNARHIISYCVFRSFQVWVWRHLPWLTVSGRWRRETVPCRRRWCDCEWWPRAAQCWPLWAEWSIRALKLNRPRNCDMNLVGSLGLVDGLVWKTGINLCMLPANRRRRYDVTSSLIGWAHAPNDPWKENWLHGLILQVPKVKYCMKNQYHGCWWPGSFSPQGLNP